MDSLYFCLSYCSAVPVFALLSEADPAAEGLEHPQSSLSHVNTSILYSGEEHALGTGAELSGHPTSILPLLTAIVTPTAISTRACKAAEAGFGHCPECSFLGYVKANGICLNSPMVKLSVYFFKC